MVFWVLVIPLTGLGFLFALGQAGGDLDALRMTRGSILDEPMLGHLWFLYHLLLYYAAAAAGVPLAARLPSGVRTMAARAFRVVATTHWGIAVLAAVTMLPILQGGEPGIGLSASLVPRPSALIAYAIFFAFGWGLHEQRDALPLYGRRWGKTAVAALASGAAYLAVVAAQQSGDLRTGMLTAAAVSALATWLLVFATIGWFVRHLPRPRPIVRYFSDAAYWIYLVHLPLTIWVPGLLAQSSLSAVTKFTLVLVVTTLITTASYEFMVRNTRIGVMLNGRRYPRGLPAAAADGARAVV